jgi:hypothetical protein
MLTVNEDGKLQRGTLAEQKMSGHLQVEIELTFRPSVADGTYQTDSA